MRMAGGIDTGYPENRLSQTEAIRDDGQGSPSPSEAPIAPGEGRRNARLTCRVLAPAMASP